MAILCQLQAGADSHYIKALVRAPDSTLLMVNDMGVFPLKKSRTQPICAASHPRAAGSHRYHAAVSQWFVF